MNRILPRKNDVPFQNSKMRAFCWSVKKFDKWALVCLSVLVMGCASEIEIENYREQLAVFYISPHGNDANDGLSPETAWQSSARVNAETIAAGTTLKFEGGTIYDSLLFNADDGGDADKRVTITSYGDGLCTIKGIDILNTSGFNFVNFRIAIPEVAKGEYPRNGINLNSTLSGGLKLNGFTLSQLNISGAYRGVAIESTKDTSGFSNVLIEKVTVHDCLDGGIVSNGFFSKSKIGYSHQNIHVTDCEVYNISGWDNAWSHTGNGIVLSDVQNSTISHCVVYNSGYANTHCGGNCGIWYWDAKDVIIEYCEAYKIQTLGCDGAGFDLDGGVVNGVMQYNYSHDNYGAGFQVGQFNGSRPLKNIAVRYNISDNDANGYSGSLFIFNSDSRKAVSNVIFHNNTIINKTGLAFKSINNWDASVVQVKNNILYGKVTANSNLSFENNYFENPNLVDYKLEMNSPLIDAGVNMNLDLVPFDYFGNPSLTGESPDIGAHEFSSRLSVDY